MNLRRMMGPLTEPSFARFFLASLISQAGSYASLIALSFAVLEKSGPTALGLIFLAREIPLIAFVLIGGVFADRLTSRHLPCVQ
jgi:hypothetical protein